MNWKCPNCREPIESALEVCWHCGTSRDGTVDLGFEHADDYEPPIPEEKPQYRLGTLLKLMVAGCLVFAMCGAVIGESWNPVAIVAGMAGLVFLGIYLFHWMLLRSVRQLQRDVRRSVRHTEAGRRKNRD